MRRYRFLALLLATLVVGTAHAQEVVSDQLIYNRVTGFMETNGHSEEYIVTPSKNIQTVRFEHDIRLSYGAPGLISMGLLDRLSFGCGCDVGPQDLPSQINNLRTYDGPTYMLANIGLSYSKQLRPWFALGAKGTFAATWQNTYDTFTKEKLYDNNCYVTSIMLESRFSWLRREKVELYSSIALGIMARIKRSAGGIAPMFDTALFGVSFGRSLYGFVEIGGGIGGSARAGIGYRFNGKK
jgi:hypothetical protein